MVEIPEIRGHLFVGRTKEGFSLNKVMVGYAGWTMERATTSDATIPFWLTA
jgi:phosphate-selective porin OprO/OprP